MYCQLLRTGSKDQVAGSKNQVTGSKDQVTGSKNQVTGSKDQVTGSKDQVTGSKDQYPYRIPLMNFPYRSGRSVLKARNTRNTPRIPLWLLVAKEMTRSINEKRTRTPSITFQPDLRYVWGPMIRPSDITCARKGREIHEYRWIKNRDKRRLRFN